MIRILIGAFLLFYLNIQANGAKYMGVEIPDELEGFTFVVDLDEKLAYPMTTGKNCTVQGPMCENCQESSMCIQQADGWLKITTTCPATQTCLDSTGLCTSNSNPVCESVEYKFTCYQEGIFPNPINCKNYHLCTISEGTKAVNPEPSTFTCLGDFYYNANTTTCSKKMRNGICPSLGNPCQTPFETFPVDGNKGLYYLCFYDTTLQLWTPQVFSCINNYKYNIHTRKCEDPTLVSLLDSTGRCLSLGRFFDSITCQYYRQCTTIGNTPSRVSCGSGKHFDNHYLECVDYTCRDIEHYFY